MRRRRAAARAVARGRQAADEARDVAAMAGRVAGVDALGGEGQVEVDVRAEADRLQRLAERADVVPG